MFTNSAQIIHRFEGLHSSGHLDAASILKTEKNSQFETSILPAPGAYLNKYHGYLLNKTQIKLYTPHIFNTINFPAIAGHIV
jgi:hypothetical protein